MRTRRKGQDEEPPGSMGDGRTNGQGLSGREGGSREGGRDFTKTKLDLPELNWTSPEAPRLH